MKVRRFSAAVALLLGLPLSAQAQVPTDGLMLWLDASDASTVFQDAALTVPALAGDPVGGWADKSGNGFHATQPDAALTPAYDAAAMNGQPALRFSAAELDGMVIDDGLSLARPYSVFIVNQYSGDTRGRTLQGQDANWLTGLWAGNVSSFADGFIGGNPPADVGFTYISDTTGTPAGESTLFVNGLNFTTNPAPVGAPGRLALTGSGMFPEYSDADISEILVYNRVLDAAELTQVRDALYGKYNATILLPPNPLNTVLKGTIGSYTGADAGEGLDLQGTFAYAINVGGPAVTVGGVAFTDGSEAGMAGGSSAGASITDANEILEWHAAAYGDSPADDGLETVAASIRWNTPPGLSIDLDVSAGQEYTLQLLFAENCCDRGFDIFVDGELSVDNFSVPGTQGGIANTAAGAVFSQTFVASGDVLNITLGGVNPLAGDNNPILNGLTLEVVPEPSSFSLLALGLLCLRRTRRRSA